MRVYLDNNATAQPLKEVVAAVTRAMFENFGNPSSPHSRGTLARSVLHKGRAAIAALAGADPDGLTLTSGGTESNNLVFSSLARHVPRPRVAVSAADHASVLKPGEAVGIDGRFAVLPLRGDGTVELDALAAQLEEGLDLVSVLWASGETGVVQPVNEIAQMCRAKGVIFHSDAAQALGRIPLSLHASGVDYVSFSAHKLHGPLGVGALWAKDCSRLVAAMRGGGQESGLRSGTENVSGVAGFAAACSARAVRFDESVRGMRALRDSFERRILTEVPDVSINGAKAQRLCNTSSLRFKGIDGQALVGQLDRVGIQCSQTSACSSGHPEPSPSLLAMGLTKAEAWSTVRFSFSVMNTQEEVVLAAREVASIVARLRRFVVL